MTTPSSDQAKLHGAGEGLRWRRSAWPHAWPCGGTRSTAVPRHVALGNVHTHMEQVDQQRAATQEARVDDQAVLAGLWEQLEAAHAEALTATRQRMLANNRVAMAEAE